MNEKQFIQLLKGNQTRYKKPDAVLKNALGVSQRTMVKYINHPAAMSVNDFCIVAKELRLTEQDVLEFMEGYFK